MVGTRHALNVFDVLCVSHDPLVQVFFALSCTVHRRHLVCLCWPAFEPCSSLFFPGTPQPWDGMPGCKPWHAHDLFDVLYLSLEHSVFAFLSLSCATDHVVGMCNLPSCRTPFFQELTALLPSPSSRHRCPVIVVQHRVVPSALPRYAPTHAHASASSTPSARTGVARG
jgi:hypothetical protein